VISLQKDVEVSKQQESQQGDSNKKTINKANKPVSDSHGALSTKLLDN
jgi:hypothetical protein